MISLEMSRDDARLVRRLLVGELTKIQRSAVPPEFEETLQARKRRVMKLLKMMKECLAEMIDA